MTNILRSPKTLIAILVGLAGALLVLYAWRLPPFHSTVEKTNNAYVRGQVTLISPQLPGYVTRVAVHDFQTVKAGDLLVQIDDRSYAQKLAQAQATLAAQKANLANAAQGYRSAQASIVASQAQVAGAQAGLTEAQANARRYEALLDSAMVSRSSVDQTRATLLNARATVQATQAAVEVARQDLQSNVVGRQALEAAVENAEAVVRQAQIDLQNTRVVAPVDGQLGEVGVKQGQYVAAGTQLMSLVPGKKWLIANFKENQVEGMRVGQAVTFEADALRDVAFKGHVEGFSPATGSEFSVLKADNATGNFTKVAQRLPVRISIDPGQSDAEVLAPGMSVVVSIDKAQPGGH